MADITRKQTPSMITGGGVWRYVLDLLPANRHPP